MTLDEMDQKLLSNVERLLKQNNEWFENVERYCKLVRGHSNVVLRKIALFKEEKTRR